MAIRRAEIRLLRALASADRAQVARESACGSCYHKNLAGLEVRGLVRIDLVDKKKVSVTKAGFALLHTLGEKS